MFVVQPLRITDKIDMKHARKHAMKVTGDQNNRNECALATARNLINYPISRKVLRRFDEGDRKSAPIINWVQYLEYSMILRFPSQELFLVSNNARNFLSNYTKYIVCAVADMPLSLNANHVAAILRINSKLILFDNNQPFLLSNLDNGYVVNGKWFKKPFIKYAAVTFRGFIRMFNDSVSKHNFLKKAREMYKKMKSFDM